ncbi:MAG: phosphoenolpyruvate carboxylase [Bacteriovorax sp.]|nr:phosphoenolpyruvate carboxylase [Bacteriovorax sp.]
MEIPTELKNIVYESVKILGLAIKETYGDKMFFEIEKLRHEMKKIRNTDADTVHRTLEIFYLESKKSRPLDLHQKTKAFSLMLELINTCEAAFRSFRLSSIKTCQDVRPLGMVFVFTSHPTEARSTQFLFIMDKIEALILKALQVEIKEVESEMFYLLTLALKIDLANNKKPDVRDEAEQIFHTVLSKNILDEQLKLKANGINVYFKTWAGGDKDGHPLVGPETMIQSLTLSRNKLLDYILIYINEYEEEMKILKQTRLISTISSFKSRLKLARKIGPKDGILVNQIITSFRRIKFKSPALDKLSHLLNLYPAIVLPLELREDHELIHAALLDPKVTISLMLKELKKISFGVDPRGYVNSFVISMCMSSNDMLAAAQLTNKILGNLDIPIVPLFENEVGLTSSLGILTEAFEKFPFEKIHKKKWNGLFEVMLGYSDSTKESGVLPGRLMVEKTAHELEAHVLKRGLTPVFFHGSGGSINRGGGSVKEQLSWLPKSSLNLYKATIQGEMVQRQFQQPLIMRSQINKIIAEFNNFKLLKFKHSSALSTFSKSIQSKYKSLVMDDAFQKLVQEATPYEFLNLLKIGSRPIKRTGAGKLTLRAIPWTLCWTQTRLLLPIWWGVGSSWSELSKQEKKDLIQDYEQSPLLQTYIKNLGFTLAKIELGVWKFHLEHTKLSPKEKIDWNDKIEKELIETQHFFKALTGNLDYLWFRPWLEQSIYFRSSMIHPLNVIQKIALERKDHVLLRETVTGISCGMLTTG